MVAALEIRALGPAGKRVEPYELSYASERQASRLRLSPGETSAINYVLVGWESEAGTASNFGAMQAALAARADPESRAASGSRETQTAKPRAHARTFEPLSDLPAERWADKGKRESASATGCGSSEETLAILRCYRALVALARARSPSASVLASLYGDRPAGLPDVTLVSACDGRDAEYLRVVRYVPASGYGSATLCARLTLDRRKAPSESEGAYKARLARQTLERRALLSELCAACERLIVAAAVDYRQAWKAQA